MSHSTGVPLHPVSSYTWVYTTFHPTLLSTLQMGPCSPYTILYLSLPWLGASDLSALSPCHVDLWNVQFHGPLEAMWTGGLLGSGTVG